ncbi:transketolase [Candidatus Peregrinibacteria bacterium]|nr:transketolase [Candidatus Peregrinibacteria bacterium]
MTIPKLTTPLTNEQINFLQTFSKSCRRSILEMVTNAQSGHPGGSLSCIDYLSVLYAFIIGQTGEKICISNGHISPAVYSTLAEMDYIPKNDVVKNFRKIGSVYEGHITRHVPGIWYGTGPLGIGVSVASAFAWHARAKASALAKEGFAQQNTAKVFALVGDGECQEGEIYETMHFARKYKLDNLILFVDYNKVQLTASIKEIMNLDLPKVFAASDWNVIEVDGHDYQKIWAALGEAYKNTGKPTVLIGHTTMGQGVDFMEVTGKEHKADWHGKAPKTDQITEQLKALTLSAEEENLLNDFRKNFVKWKPTPTVYPPLLSKTKIKTGTPITYKKEELTDCRTAYGKALLDLVKNNPDVVALTADLKDSVMTKFVAAEFPDRHIECGIAEQHMISASGGLSLDGLTPFCSTFGAFMSSRAKDQARVNDINYTNVKMVATHCGLSVGEDGPTHQAIDDMSSFLGMFNTMVIEPADPNQTDHIIRYAASHYGNFYVRMGRHKFPIVTKADGTAFYDANYKYEYGKSDVIREGKDLTIAATGAMVNEAMKAREILAVSNPNLSIEIIAVSSIKKFDAKAPCRAECAADETLIKSIKKTGKILTIEDHNVHCGLGNQLAAHLLELGFKPATFKSLGVTAYQLSGTSDALYHANELDAEGIKKTILEII